MLFFVFLSLVAMFDLLGSGGASCASRLCGTHRCPSVFVDFNHAPSGVRAAREAFETFRASRDDRVGVGAGLDCVTLFNLLVKKRVERVPARAQGIDVTHEREYRKSGFAAETQRFTDAPRGASASLPLGREAATCTDRGLASRRLEGITGLVREVESARLGFAGRLSGLAERVPAARCALPLPVPEWQGRCFIYGNRNREVVQRRQGVWVHYS
jgi:hypothetical protein